MIITTKKGIELGKPIITYSGSYSIETPSNVLTPMRSAELDGFFRDATWLDSRLAPDYLQDNPNYNLTQFLKTNEIVQGYNNGLDEDWWGGLTRNGAINNHNISIRGKNKDIGYFVSGGYTDVEGFMINDDYTRYSMRMNLDANINTWMKVGIESFITSSDYSGYSPGVGNAFILQPWAPINDANGELILFPEGSILNPYAQLEIEDSDKRLNIFGNVHAEIKLPVKGLTYKISYSQNYRTSNQDQYNPYGANLTGSGYKNSGIGYDWSVDNMLSYIKTFNEIHSLNATFVYGVEKRTGSNTNSSAQKFDNGSLGYNRLEAGDPTLNVINTGAWQETSLYTMGRIIYNLSNKYLVTGTIRRDGFSGFGTNEKIGIFPSFALGWVASEESFVKENVDWLNYFKLRGSYGSTGRRAVSRYQTMAIMSSQPSYIFGEGGLTTSGQWISSMANNDLGWETTTGLNLGFDFAVINSRIYGNFEYYNNNTDNILYNIQLPQMTGFGSIATNIGKVHNNGIEFSITGVPVKIKDFNWESTINFSRNRNEIVSILGFDNNDDGKEDDLVSNGLFIGEPQQVIYSYEITGMWQMADQTAGSIPTGFFPGTYKIADLSGPDGVPDGAYSATHDRKILGYVDPAYRLSWVNRLNYKKFSLYMVINSIQGGKNYYMGDDSPYSSGNWTRVEQLKYLNVPSGSWDYWMPENPDAKYRRLDTGSAYSPRPYTQRNFIRLQDVSLSYTFDKSLVNKVDIGALKIYVSAQNLITITKWKGWDPETGSGFAPGMPLMKNFTVGLNVEF
jgi:TonB-linked SusC/RagA family outer membrane protein